MVLESDASDKSVIPNRDNIYIGLHSLSPSCISRHYIGFSFRSWYCNIIRSVNRRFTELFRVYYSANRENYMHRISLLIFFRDFPNGSGTELSGVREVP